MTLTLGDKILMTLLLLLETTLKLRNSYSFYDLYVFRRLLDPLRREGTSLRES